jgi:hypothetical protein
MSAYMHIIREYVGTPSQIPTGRDKMLKKDMLLNPAQKVRVVRTVSIAYDLDISDYLDGDTNLDGADITVGNLESDIESYADITDVLDEMGFEERMTANLEITDIKVEITEIV